MYFVVTRLLFMAGHLQWPQQPSQNHKSQGADNFCSNMSGSCFNIHVYNAPGCHKFLYFTLLLFIYSLLFFIFTFRNGSTAKMLEIQYTNISEQNKNRHVYLNVTDMSLPQTCPQTRLRELQTPRLRSSLPGFTNFPHIQKTAPYTRYQKDNMKQSPCSDPHFWMDL